MEEKHLIIIIKKPADKEEVLAAVEFIKPHKISIITYKQNPRIQEKDIAEWFFNKKNLCFYKLEHKGLGTKQFLNYLNQFEPYHSIALPVGNLRPLYKSVPNLRKKEKTIIHISDGVPDSFSLLDFSLAIKGKGIKGISKALFTFWGYYRAKADYCFFQLYPLVSCLAKNTFPSMKAKQNGIPNIIIEQLKNSKVDTLLLPGWGETIETLLTEYPEITNYCATSKELLFTINGKSVALENFITAEDIIYSNLISKVIGTGSSAMYSAKLFNPNITCKVLLNGVLNKHYGNYYEFFYEKKGKELGIIFKSKG